MRTEVLEFFYYCIIIIIAIRRHLSIFILTTDATHFHRNANRLWKQNTKSKRMSKKQDNSISCYFDTQEIHSADVFILYHVICFCVQFLNVEPEKLDLKSFFLSVNLVDRRQYVPVVCLLYRASIWFLQKEKWSCNLQQFHNIE